VCDTDVARCVRTYNIKDRLNNTPPDRSIDSRRLTHGVSVANNFAAAGDGLNTATFLWNPPTAIRGPAINVRVDHNFNQNNSVFARYLWSDYNTLKGDPLNGRPQVYPDNPPLGEVFRRTSNLAIGWRRVFSPRVVNEFTAGYGRSVSCSRRVRRILRGPMCRRMTSTASASRTSTPRAPRAG
jgi:hypothetical protein